MFPVRYEESHTEKKRKKTHWSTLLLGEINTGTSSSELGILRFGTVKVWFSVPWRLGVGQCPAAVVSCRPDLSTERAPHINKPATV
jgi:hypothetical protein